MELKHMYAPQKDSPTTFLLGAINSTDTFVIVGNAQLLPSVVPFPLTLGPDKTVTETVMVTEVNLGNNRIIFERGPGALPWPSGTTVARTFNADDLKSVQENIVGINSEVETSKSDISSLTSTVGGLNTVVGNAGSGLVKGLADEVTRAKAAEAAETLRATTAENALNSSKINRSELPQILIDASYSADATKLTTTLSRYNASNQQSGTYNRILPLVSSSTVGIMTPEAYNEITSLRNDVLALQQQGGRFIGLSFATKSALDSYIIPESVKVGDFTYVIDDEAHDDATTRYIYDGAVFNFGFVVNYDPVGLATDEVPGLVKSTDGIVLGKIFVEADGTMSITGWDETILDINNRVPTTRKINGKELSEDITIDIGEVITPEQHRMIFRGKNLGTSPTPAQLASIRDGSFDDLYIGDYWVNGGITYRIADMNYLLNSGDTATTKPHLIIVPDQSMMSSKMNDSNITTTGYYGSYMHQTTIPAIDSILVGIFGSALLSNRLLLTNASVNGRPSAGSWYTVKSCLMQENQVYGGNIFAQHSDGVNIPYVYTIAKQQFALFQIVPKCVNPGRYSYWLQDIVSASSFAHVSSYGYAYHLNASDSRGVRVWFALG